MVLVLNLISRIYCVHQTFPYTPTRSVQCFNTTLNSLWCYPSTTRCSYCLVLPHYNKKFIVFVVTPLPQEVPSDWCYPTTKGVPSDWCYPTNTGSSQCLVLPHYCKKFLVLGVIPLPKEVPCVYSLHSSIM